MKVYFDYNKQAIIKVEDGSSVYMGDLTTVLEVIANADIHTTHYVLVSAKLPNGRIIGPFLSDPDIQETANVNEGTEYTINPDSTTWKFTMTPEHGFKFVKGLTNLYIWLCTTDGKRKCLGAVNFNVNEAHAYDEAYFISVDDSDVDEVLTNMEAQIAQLQLALQNVTLIEGNPEDAATEQLKKVLIGTKVYSVVNGDDLANYQSKIDNSHKLSSDLVDDTGHTNKFVTEQDKTNWNAKQNAIDSSHKLNADLVDDTNAAHKFASSGQLTAINQAGYDGAGAFEPNADVDMTEHSKTLYVNSADVSLEDRQESLGSALSNIEDDIADIDDDKLAKKPNGTDDLISNGKINTSYIPDAILGQLLFGGVVTGEGYALLTPAAKSRLGTSQDNIQLTNDNTAVTGYGANASIFYVMLSNGSFANLTLKTGDWLISLGSRWAKVDNTDEVTSVNGSTGAITITAASLGLGNVDNTSDANKPVSTAQQAALNAKADAADFNIITLTVTNGTLSQDAFDSIKTRTIIRYTISNPNSTNDIQVYCTQTRFYPDDNWAGDRVFVGISVEANTITEVIIHSNRHFEVKSYPANLSNYYTKTEIDGKVTNISNRLEGKENYSKRYVYLTYDYSTNTYTLDSYDDFIPVIDDETNLPTHERELEEITVFAYINYTSGSLNYEWHVVPLHFKTLQKPDDNTDIVTTFSGYDDFYHHTIDIDYSQVGIIDPDPTYFDVTVSQHVSDEWCWCYIYKANDITKHNNQLFVSLQSGNQNHAPDSTQDTAYWARVFV